MKMSFARLSVWSLAAVAGLGVGLLHCGGDAGGDRSVDDSGDGGSPGASGGRPTGGRGGGSGGRPGGRGGTAGAASGGAAGTPGSASGGAPPDSGAAHDTGGPDVAGSFTDSGSSGTGWAGVPGIEDLSTVKASGGCGKPAPTGVSSNDYATRMITIPMPIRGSGMRRYTLKLPAKYDNNKPYGMVFQAPGCTGSTGPLGDFTQLAGGDGVVQAVLQYEPGVGIYPQCFDDKRTDSVEYAYFEAVLSEIESQVCIDEHLVFLGGHSSGAWLSNQLGCVYGSTLIRAIFPASGGLAVSPRDDVMGVHSAPPCKDLPTPGIWTHNQDDTTNPPIGTRSAIERALRVNKCTSTDFNGPRAPFSAPGTGMNCESFSTCPKEFPIVFCHPPTGGHPPPSFAPAADWQFMSLFK